MRSATTGQAETPGEGGPLRLGEGFYAPRPTKMTVFLRTFLPWQMWRFVVINLKMLRIIGRSHH